MKTLTLALALSAGLFGQSFPSSIYTPLKAADNLQTTLTVAMAAGDTTAFVASSSRWAANMIGYICDTTTVSGGIARCTGTYEAMLVTAVPGANALTVTRAFGGTSAIAHASGKAVINAPVSVYNTWVNNEVLAIETALGTNLSNVLGAAAPVLNTATYNFAAQTPGGSLIIGSNVITMTPCPLGVAGTHTVAANQPHLLYLSGGTGTAEAAPITGGTCTSGAATGTVIVAAANTHSGAWTIAPNSGGIQECIYVAGATGACRIPGGDIQLRRNTSTIAAVVIPDGWATSVRGAGDRNTRLLTGGTTGDWVTAEWVSAAAGTGVDIGDFQIDDANGIAHTAGVMVKVRHRGTGNVNHILIFNAYDGVWQEGCQGTQSFEDIFISHAHRGFSVTCNGAAGAVCANQGYVSRISTNQIGNNTVGLYVTDQTQGLVLDRLFLQRASGTNTSSTVFQVAAATPLNEIILSNSFLDSDYFGVQLLGNASAYANNSIQLIGNHIHTVKYGVLAQDYFSNMLIANNFIDGVDGAAGGMAIRLAGNTKNSKILGNALEGDSTCIYVPNANTQIDIRGNTCGQQTTPVYGVQFATAASTGVRIQNNTWTYSTGAYLGSSPPASLTMLNNVGIDDVTPAVASAATLAFPVNPYFTVSGSTNVTAVTHPLAAGARGTITATDATITFASGATIGSPFILKQNRTAGWFWDGTKVWLTGQDPALTISTNYIATEGGANNAITGTLTGVTLAAGLTVQIKLAHTLQAGANTFNLNGGGAVNIKSCRNVANNLGTAYAATGTISLTYDGAVWCDPGQ